MSSKRFFRPLIFLAAPIFLAQHVAFSQGVPAQQSPAPATAASAPAAFSGGPPPLPPDFPPAPVTRARPEPGTPAAPTNRTASPAEKVVKFPPVPAVGNSTPPLAWDSDFKEITAKPGDVTAYLNFALTNIAKEPLTIRAVRPSCGCTLAEIPPVPWVLDPGSNGVIKTSVDLRGKRQMVSKSITVDTSHGYKVLSFRVIIPEATTTNAVAGGMQDRVRNTAIASADRQAVFRGDCAKCHVEPGVGKTGLALYTASCGICHEGEHRAAFVPDLKQLKAATNPDYWRHSIMNGKPGSLMPAFAKAQGGPLTDPQIQSLVDYLSATIKPQTPAAVSAAPSSVAPAK